MIPHLAAALAWGKKPLPLPEPEPLNLALETVLAITICWLLPLLLRYLWRDEQPMQQVGVVTGIVVYPLKSAKGVVVQSATVEARGLSYDRLWMAVDANGHFV